MSIHSCIADPNRLYVLTSDQKIYVSTNALSATPTFTPYNLPSASSSIATVTAICNNANTVYISVNNRESARQMVGKLGQILATTCLRLIIDVSYQRRIMAPKNLFCGYQQCGRYYKK
ncbi:MAG: hypothetical protein IPN94_23675 [Sphingobacteriales bacterium]|nr:hypothetical protein [Sphingobacteriales bacterium]